MASHLATQRVIRGPADHLGTCQKYRAFSPNPDRLNQDLLLMVISRCLTYTTKCEKHWPSGPEHALWSRKAMSLNCSSTTFQWQGLDTFLILGFLILYFGNHSVFTSLEHNDRIGIKCKDSASDTVVHALAGIKTGWRVSVTKECQCK